jgi:putative membrane protein
MRLVLRILINAAALWVAVRIVPGIAYTGTPLMLLCVAIVFGVVNTIVKPIVTLLSIPAILLTLGLFLLVVNALMLWLTGWLSTVLGLGFQVQGIGPALLGAIVVSLVAWTLSMFLAEPKESRSDRSGS